jgi:thymidylate synthase
MNIDKQYQTLLQTILTHGVIKQDRTGTGTKSIFGYTVRHNMQEGFPLLTTKKMAWKSIVTELIWFLRGDTNIKYLLDNGCNIWTGDAFGNYLRTYKGNFVMDEEEFVNAIKNAPEFAERYGDLGPIYGKQWRSWKHLENHNFTKITYVKTVDQIANLINDLKTNPDSRRLMVNAWNVGELDQMVLPPCHYGFQVYTRELNLDERIDIYNSGKVPMNRSSDYFHEHMDSYGIPRRAISLMWNQRSVDTFLGLPFNIASYGLLLEIIAKEVNMVPDELIGNLGDVHLYSNHVEQAKEQIGRELTWEEKIQWVMKNTDVEMENLYITEAAAVLEKSTREPYPLPTLKIESGVKWKEGDCLPTYSVSDFSIENYKSHPAIKAQLSN